MDQWVHYVATSVFNTKKVSGTTNMHCNKKVAFNYQTDSIILIREYYTHLTASFPGQPG